MRGQNLTRQDTPDASFPYLPQSLVRGLTHPIQEERQRLRPADRSGAAAWQRPGRLRLTRSYLGAAELALTGSTRPIKGESAVALQAVAEGRDGLVVPTANGPEAAVVWESVCLTPLEAFVAVSLLSGYSFHAPLGRPHRKSPEAAPLSLAKEFMMALAYACRVLGCWHCGWCRRRTRCSVWVAAQRPTKPPLREVPRREKVNYGLEQSH